MTWFDEWEAFYLDRKSKGLPASCMTCGYDLRKTTHWFTSETGQSRSHLDGLSCERGNGAIAPLGTRRRSVIEGFKSSFTSMLRSDVESKSECKCDVRDLMSPCGHSSNCAWMRTRKKAA